MIAAPTKSDVVRNLRYDRIPALALDHPHDGLFMVCTDHGVALPVTDLLTTLDVQWALAQGSAIGNLAPAITPAGVPLSLLFLAAQVLPQRATAGLLRINVLVERLVAHRQLACDLFRTPLQLQQHSGLLLHPRGQQCGIATALGTLMRQFTCLFGPVATATRIAAQLTADRGFAAAQQICNLCDVVSGFHKAVNLISFNLAASLH